VAPSSDEVGTLRSELDAVKKDRDEWRHKFTSNAGRIAAYQKTIADLKNQVTLLQGDSRQPAAAKSADASKAKPKESPTLKKLESVDPTLAEFLKEYREEIETDLKSEFEGGLKNTNKVIVETQNRDFLEKEHAKLRSVVTNLDEVISSKEFAYFRDNVASPAVQKLLESDFADDALVGLEIYETWCDRVVSAKKGDPKSEPKEEIKEEPKKEEPKPKEDLKKVIEARDRRLNATDVSSTPPTPKGSGEFDPEALFNEAFNKRLSKVMPTKR
jgi:flagellar biosynthesis chaperone FliJ